MALAQRWPYVVQPNMQTILAAQFFMLAQRWPYVVYPTPTISQRSNGLPTLAQRSHAIWELTGGPIFASR